MLGGSDGGCRFRTGGIFVRGAPAEAGFNCRRHASHAFYFMGFSVAIYSVILAFVSVWRVCVLTYGFIQDGNYDWIWRAIATSFWFSLLVFEFGCFWGR